MGRTKGEPKDDVRMTKQGGGNQIPHKKAQCKTWWAATHPQGQPAPVFRVYLPVTLLNKKAFAALTLCQVS